ncbi:MAG: 4-hydroxythreonine-4-phosphate dehydrogenase PdxA [Planctomycetota bacterium]
MEAGLPSFGTRPLLALTLGDPAGIGPEIALRAREDARVRDRVRLVLIGPGSLRPREVPLRTAGDLSTPRSRGEDRSADPVWIDSGGPGSFEMGRVQASCGRAAIAALRVGHDLAMDGRVDALVTCPVSKSALHLAGEAVEGQTELLGRWAGVERIEMLAIAGRMRVMLLTRHLPLRAAIDQITVERVVDRLELLDQSLRRLGIGAPRVALAGLNPHAGEGGILGSEDEEILRPAVAILRDRGLDVVGPRAPDTVFLQASRGEFDGVLALYHDQAFIPIKLLSHEEGVTVLAGLPYLRVSPVHGTAFDIAGRGKASHENLVAAILFAAERSGLRNPTW